MKTDAWKLGLLWGVIVLLAATTASGQNGVVSIKRLDGLISGTTVRAGDDLRFVFQYNNSGATGTGRACDISNGFKVSSPDGAVWDSIGGSGLGTLTWLYDSTFFPPTVDTTPQWSWFSPRFSVTYSIVPKITYSHRTLPYDPSGNVVGLLAAGSPRMATSFNDSTWSVTVYFHDKSSAGKHICIDSSFFGEGGVWKWVGSNLADFFPTYEGLTPAQSYSDGLPGTRLGSGYCFELYAPLLQTSDSELSFTAEAGGSSPSPQSFSVLSTGDGVGDHLNFSLVESAPWLNKSPASGTTPRNIQVSVNTAGLAAGTYTDSIRVESVGAGNSPLYVRVILNVTSPAPTIAVNKSSLTFLGLEGGSDPAPQTFVVKNVGGSVLNWTTSHLQPWLNVVPGSGVDSSQVNASVSLIGLLSGDYYDTILVQDPAATNSPAKVAVKLSIGSSLPTIAVDSAVNHIIRQSGSSLTFSRSVYVRNGGVGALSFTVSENSSRIQSLAPTSGNAPESLQVSFKLSGANNITYHDTVWVTSPEAVNSPYPVVFLTRVVDVAQLLSVSLDTINLVTYLCSQGPDSVLPQENFYVSNIGGSNPMVVDLVAESDLFTLTSTSQEATAFFNVQATYPDLPAGVYYDTILVTSEWATNSPRRVIVRYERSAGSQWHILIPYDSVVVAGQEQTGPASFLLHIANQYPGCMSWVIDEEIPWVTMDKTNGVAPNRLVGLVDIDNLVLGTYRDSLYVAVAGADNSPRKVIVIGKVWRLHGDWNWSGFIDVTDLSWQISYLTSSSPYPQPELKVGDVTCDDLIDLFDLSTLIAYLTSSNVYLCGNP